jgi:hypothetical protein
MCVCVYVCVCVCAATPQSIMNWDPSLPLSVLTVLRNMIEKEKRGQCWAGVLIPFLTSTETSVPTF